MGSNNINSASAKANSNAEILQNTKLDANNLSNKISIFNNSVMAALKQKGGEDYIDSSDGIDEREADILKKWANCIDKIVGNISEDVRTKCEDAMNTLRKLHASLMCTIEERGIGGVKERLQEGLENKNIEYVGNRASLYTDEKEEALTLEPTETDSQTTKSKKIMSEKDWLASVPEIVKETYLRTVRPQDYQGHGGTMDVMRKTNNAKIGGLQGIIKTYNDVLLTEQKQFLEQEIQRYKELAKLENSGYAEETSDTQTEHYGSAFFDNPENGEALIKTMKDVYSKEGLTLANVKKTLGMDEE